MMCVIDIESNIRKGGTCMNSLYEDIDRIYQQSKVYEEAIEKVDRISAERFEDCPPDKPVKRVAQFDEIKVESKITKPKSWYWHYAKIFMIGYAALTVLSGIANYIMFAIWLFLLPIAGVIALALRAYRTKQYYKLKDDDVKRIKSSEEYRDEYQRRLNIQKSQQQIYDQEYREALEVYDKDYADWENAKHAFEADQKLQCNAAIEYKKEQRKILNKMFDDFGKIPNGYRTYECIKYVRNILGSSDLDIKTALEMYDREQQRILEHERIEALNEQNRLQSQRNAELEYQSQLQEQANDIAQKHRRESAAFGAYNAYQNSKQTKMMKDEQRQRERAKAKYEKDHRNDRIKRAVDEFNRNSRYH